MTDYLVTHDTLAEVLLLGAFLLISISLVGVIHFARLSAPWFCCLLAALCWGATLPYHVSIKHESDRRQALQAEQHEITLDEYRHLRT